MRLVIVIILALCALPSVSSAQIPDWVNVNVNAGESHRSPRSVLVELFDLDNGVRREVALAWSESGYVATVYGEALTLRPDGTWAFAGSEGVGFPGWDGGAVGKGFQLVGDGFTFDVVPLTEDWGETYLNNETYEQFLSGGVTGAFTWATLILLRFFWQEIQRSWFRAWV